MRIEAVAVSTGHRHSVGREQGNPFNGYLTTIFGYLCTKLVISLRYLSAASS